MPRILYFINKRNPMKFLSCDQQWPGEYIRKKARVQREDKLKHERGRQAKALARRQGREADRAMAEAVELRSVESCVLTTPVAAHSLALLLLEGRPPTTSTWLTSERSVKASPGPPRCALLCAAHTARVFSHLALSMAVINHLGT